MDKKQILGNPRSGMSASSIRLYSELLDKADGKGIVLIDPEAEYKDLFKGETEVQGVIIGHSKDSIPVIIDPFKFSNNDNPNSLVMGVAGQGMSCSNKAQIMKEWTVLGKLGPGKAVRAKSDRLEK